jgi:phosphopantetheinyl transferase
MSVGNRPSLHGTAGIATPLQQVQSRPQQMSASSQVHFEHIIFSTKVVVDVFFVSNTKTAFMSNICVW